MKVTIDVEMRGGYDTPGLGYIPEGSLVVEQERGGYTQSELVGVLLIMNSSIHSA